MLVVVPLIGLTGRSKLGADLAGTVRAMRTQAFDVHVHAYSQMVAAHGGLPVQLPMALHAETTVARLDGLVLTGGADIDPARYDAPLDPATGRFEPERDTFELEVLRAARRHGIPVLGICRGCQLINVAFGGSLHQHVEAHARFAEDPASIAHEIRIAPNSELARAHGTVVGVNSLHHQALDRIGEDLVVTGWSDDGIAEAIEHRNEAIVAVQWHPELLGAPQPLFGWLVQAALSRRRRARG